MSDRTKSHSVQPLARSTPHRLGLLLCLAAAPLACSSPATSGEARSAGPSTGASSGSPIPVIDTSAQFAAAPGSSSEAASSPAVSAPRSSVPVVAALEDRSSFERSLLADPQFRRRAENSLLAESELEPKLSEEERQVLFDALEKAGAGELDEAARILDEERGDTSSALLDFERARLFRMQDQPEQAMSALEVATGKHAKFLRAWRMLGEVAALAGDFETAAPAIVQVIALQGGDSVDYGILGQAYYRLEDDLSAETAYRMALLLDPGSRLWQLGLAGTLLRQERFSELVALCQRVLEQQPDAMDLWLIQARAYVGLGEVEHAAQNYEMVDRLGRSTPANLADLGDLYVSMDLYEQGVDRHLDGLRRDPVGNVSRALRSARGLTGRAAYVPLRRLLDGVDSLAGTHLAAADVDLLRKYRQRMAFAEGKSDEYREVLEATVEDHPQDGDSWLLLGQASQRQEKYDEARVLYENAAAIEGFEAKAKVAIAQMLVHQRNYADALPLLRRALELQPADGSLRQLFEQVQRAAGKS